MSSVSSRKAPESRIPLAAKAVYFATGSPEMAGRDIVRLGLMAPATALRVVCPAESFQQLACNPALKSARIISYSNGRALWIFLRLLCFLGFSRNAAIVCLSTPQNYRLLKLLAFSLRGRGWFSTGDGPATRVSILSMLRLSWHNFRIRRERRNRALPVLVIGSASARNLRQLAPRIRARHPGQRLILWAPSTLNDGLQDCFDEIALFPEEITQLPLAASCLLRERSRFGANIIPCTNDFTRWLKITALLLPLREKEIYNELGDAFEFFNVRAGLRHLSWRFFRTNRRLTRPVAVMGSASGYYLEKIVRSIRASFPGSEIHGWLAPQQAASASALFDVVHPLPSSAPSLRLSARLAGSGRRFRSWIIPCTDEPFRGLKAVAFLLPLPDRRLYNETGDGFPLANLPTVWRHICWRLRDRFTFQFLSGSSESSLARRIIHVPAYALRLIMAAPLLARATGSLRNPGALGQAAASGRVDLLVTPGSESQSAIAMALTGRPGSPQLQVQELKSNREVFPQLLQAAQTSKSEFIGVLDGQAQFSRPGWLEELVAAFDETVAQVGPELCLTANREIYQGAFFNSDGDLFWNNNSAARFHRREQWLEVAALPWICLLIRRDALLQIADQCKRHSTSTEWFMEELCQLLASNGWLSICNTAVTVSHPLKAATEEMHLSTAS